MTDDSVVIYLKEPIRMASGEAFKNHLKVKTKTKTDKNGNQIPKTAEELDKEAPDLCRGDELAAILMHKIKPDNMQQAAELNRLAKKIHNIMQKEKGEWKIEEDTLDDIIKYLGTIQLTEGMQAVTGDIYDMLELAKEQFTSKKQAKTR